MGLAMPVLLKLTAITIFSFTICLSCISSSGGTPEFEAAKVIERIGGKEESPSWTSGAQASFLEDGDVVFVNTTTMNGDSRPEACMQAASEFGRSNILRTIKEAMTTSGQTSEASADTDAMVESFITVLSKGELSGIKVKERYWERREESDASGKRVLRLRCASKVAIKKSILQRKMTEAISKSDLNEETRKFLRAKEREFFESL